MRKIKSRAQRIEIIRGHLSEANNNPKAGNKRITIRGESQYPRVIRLPIDYLMFRLENARTRRQQLKYLRKHPDLPRDLFKDPETSRAQEAQEEILLEMINATGKDFLEDLDERGQEDPAIITYDGYIVNGNRRTAALRSINADYVDCVVLPENFTKKEIYDLELDLQISQDFKEAYHWINELIDIEQGMKDRSIEENEDEIARRLHIDKERLNSKLRMKILVDKFLDWKGKSGEYDYEKLDESEQDFKELEKESRKSKFKNNPLLLEQAQKAVFVLIDQKPAEGRSYAWIRDLFRHFEQVYENIKQKTELPKTKAKSPAKGGILDALAGDESLEIVDVFNDSDTVSVEKNSKLLQETIKDVKAENTEKRDMEAVYESVSEALRQLQGLVITDHTAKIESVHNKLEEILKLTSELLKQTKKQRK